MLDADLVTPVRVTLWENKKYLTVIAFLNAKKEPTGISLIHGPVGPRRLILEVAKL